MSEGRLAAQPVTPRGLSVHVGTVGFVPETGAAVFWSYSHEDDALDGGGVLNLASRLQEEFALITGSDLDLFVDRDSIQWGDEWRSRIEHALVETTFFIPVITPRYFTRAECRRELLTFHGQAESFGVSELILPILYIDVPDLRDDHSDEAVALIARLEHADWTELRLSEPRSPDFRRAVNGLAQRLAAVSEAVTTKQLEREEADLRQDEEETAPGLLELVEQIRSLLPDWLDAVQTDQVVDAQHQATDRLYTQKLDKLVRSGAPAGARFLTLNRFARDELPIAQKHLELAREYLAKTVELDPAVLSAIRIAGQSPNAVPLLDDLRMAVDEAIEAIRRSEERGKTQETMEAWARRHAHISRLMRQMGDTYHYAHKVVSEANALVEKWAEALSNLRSPQTAASTVPRRKSED